MQFEDFEQVVWKYTDVYDKNVLLGPVTFAKLKGLWKLGRIGPGTTVSSEALMHSKPLAIKRVKGMMTALSRKDGGNLGEQGGGEEGAGGATTSTTRRASASKQRGEKTLDSSSSRHRRRKSEGERESSGRTTENMGKSGGQASTSLFSPGKVFYSQLWYCQMPNGDVVGPLKTKTLYNLWMTGKVGAHFLVRAKTNGLWPSDRTYTVEGLMQALQLLHPEMKSFIPDIPASLGTVSSQQKNNRGRRFGTGSGGGDHHSSAKRITRQSDLRVEERLPPNSTVKEVVVTLAEGRPTAIEVEPSPSPSSSSSSSFSSDSASSSVSESISSPSEASSASFSLQVERERETTSGRRRSSEGLRAAAGAGPSSSSASQLKLPNGVNLNDRLEEAKAEITRLQHRLEQSEKEKIQAREVALSLRTMLVEQKKNTQSMAKLSTSLPRSPLVENSIPAQSLELKKLSDMSTDNLYSYANSLRAENEKLQTMRKEIVNAHKLRGSSGISTLHVGSGKKEERERSFTPVPFDISGVPLSSRTDHGRGLPKSSSVRKAGTVEDSIGFVSIPPAPRETYQSSTKSVHAESLVGPASSPYNGGSYVPVRSRNRRESDPCECVQTDPPTQDLGSLEDEREIELFLTPRENASTSRTQRENTPYRMETARDSSGAPPRKEKEEKEEEESFSFHRRSSSQGQEPKTDFYGDSEADESSDFAAIDALQKKVEALSRSVEKSKMQTKNLQEDLEESRGTTQKKWSKDINPHPTRYQARSNQIDEQVKIVCDRFKNDGFHLPLTYTDGFGYSLGGKKIHLAVFGTKLNIRFGGGYILFMDYLSQKKVPLQELGRGTQAVANEESS